ncbi:unnamed protein product [Allacma fusca]|uniref:Uncharacterized protein n=1 Tax=Allacma fusca TaxID=39272 RepID=A0A8J2P9M7_9HEXA|nr:unnamed protein product [Allacma fusca]
MSLYCLHKNNQDKEPGYGTPVDNSHYGSASPINAEVGLSVVETDVEIHTSSNRKSDEDSLLDASSSIKRSSYSNIQSIGSSRQTLQHNVDEILPAPKEKKSWFRLTGKRKETKDKKKKEPKLKPPKKQTKGNSLQNLQQDLQRSSGKALRSYNETMENILSTTHLTEYQIRKYHEDHKQRVLKSFSDEFHLQLQSLQKDIVAMIIEENTKLEKDITALFEQRLKQYQQQGGILAEALAQSQSSLNNLSPRSTSPTASIASISTRSNNQSPASSRTSLSEHETSSIKSKGRFSFIRVGSKSKGKPQPPSSRSPSPAQTQAEVEARAKEKLEKLTKAVQRKSEDALKSYKVTMDAFVSSTQELKHDQIRTAHAASTRTILSKFDEDFQDFFHSRNRSAVTIVQNARLNLETDMNTKLASYLQNHQEKLSREQAKSIIKQAEYFYQKEMLKFQPSLRTEREVKIKHLDVVKASLSYFDVLVKNQGWVIPATWRNEIQIKLDEKLQEILQQLKQEDDVVMQEVSSPAPVGTPADIITNLHKLSEVPVPHDRIQVGGPQEAENSFDISELILTESSPNHSLKLKSLKVSLSTEEIIAIFFDQVLNEVKVQKKVDSVATVVVSVPFVITSLEKEKLQHALHAAGVAEVRILSSLITTAIAHAQDINYFGNQFEPKLIFTTHSQKKYFSMAIVEIKPLSIITKRCTGSQSSKDGLLQTFQNCHGHLYSNGKLKQDQVSYVAKVYDTAVKQLFRENKVDALIEVRNTPGETMINRIINSVLREKPQTKLIIEGPLTGACLLAAKGSIPESIIPAKLEVYDASRSNILLAINSKVQLVEYGNQNYRPDVIFTKSLVVPPNGCTIVLREVYFKDKFAQTIGQYVLNARSKVKKCEVELRCSVKPDGVINLEAIMPKDATEGSLERTNAITVNKTPGSELNQVYDYYFPHILKDSRSAETTSQILRDQDFKQPGAQQITQQVNVPQEIPQQQIVIQPEVSSTSNSDSDSFPEQHPTTVPPVPISEKIVEAVQEYLQKAVQHGIQAHKNQMKKLTDNTTPFTDSQIQKFHENNLQAVISAFDETVRIIQQGPEITAATAEAKESMIKEINSQLVHSLSRHEVTVSSLRKKIKRWELEGECYYDDRMELLEPKSKLAHQLKSEHKSIKADVLNKFAANIRGEGLEWRDFWKAELEWRLESKLEEALEDCLQETILSNVVATQLSKNEAAVIPVPTVRARISEKKEVIPKDELRQTVREQVVIPTQKPEQQKINMPHERTIPIEGKKSDTKEAPKQIEQPKVNSTAILNNNLDFVANKISHKKPNASKPVGFVPKAGQKLVSNPNGKPNSIPNQMFPEVPKSTLSQMSPEIPKLIPHQLSSEVPKTIPYQTSPEVPKPIWNQVSPEIPKSIPNQMSPEIPKSIPTQMSPGVPKSIPTQMSPEVPKSIPTQISPEVPKSIPTQKSPEVPKSIPTQMSPEVPKSIPTQMSPGVPKSIPTQKSPEVPKSIPTQMSPGVPKSIPNQMSPDVPKSIPTQMSPDVPKSIPTQKSPEVPKSIPTQKSPEVPKSIPTQMSPGVPKSIPNQKSPTVPKSIPTQKSPEVPYLQSKVQLYKPTTIFNNGALQKEEVTEVAPQPPQKFEYKTPSAFVIIQPYSERGTRKPVTTNPGFVPIGALDRNIPTEHQKVPAALEKTKIPQVPKVASSAEKKRLSAEGNVTPTSAGSTPSPPRKSSLTTISKPTEAVKIKTPKPAVNLTTASNASKNYKPDEKRHPIPEVKDETIRPAGPVQPAVKVITKIIPTNIPSKTVSPTRQTKTSSSTSIDSPKQPSGYTYTYNFRDPTIKPVKSPLSVSTSSQFPLSSKRSNSSSSDDSRKAKRSPRSSYSSKIPTSVKSRGSPPNSKASANPKTSASGPVQPLTSPSLIKKATESAVPKVATTTSAIPNQTKGTLGVATSATSKHNKTSASVVANLIGPHSVRNADDFRKSIIKSSQNPVGKLTPDIEKEKLELIQNALNKAIKESIKFHNKAIQSVANKKQPHTERALTVHHNNHLDAILEAWNQTCSPLSACSIPNLNQVLDESQAKLKKSINAQLVTNILHYNTSIEKVSKQVKQLTIEADNHYDDLMDEFNPQDKSRTEVLNEHAKVREEVTTIYKERVNDAGLKWEDFWIFELEERLQEKLEDYLEECLPDNELDSYPQDVISHMDSSNSDLQEFTTNEMMVDPAPQHRVNTVDQSMPSMEITSKSVSGFDGYQPTSMSPETFSARQHSPAPRPVSPIYENIDTQSMKVFHSILKKNGAPSPTRQVSFKFPSSSQGDLMEKMQSFDRSNHAMSTFHFNNPNNVTPGPPKTTRTKSWPDLDSNLAAGQFITAGVKRPAVAPPPVPSKRNERLNVGIYLDENFANVGTFLNNDVNEVDLILQMPAEIVFMDDEVVVGWQAEKNRNSLNHFYLYQLIKIKASEVHPVHFKTIKHAPCTEEIIAMFFKKLHQNISLLKTGTFVNSVIITIPFTLTSAEKERIKTAARIAGLPNVRVLSSLVTMAVAYARETQFYLMDRPKEKTILVVHYLKHSFSMAVLEISQTSIITRRCFGSENMPEGHQVAFLSSHALMFGNGTLNQKQDIYILNIYKKALHELSSGTSASWDRIIIVKEQQTTKLDKVLDNLFGKQNQARGYLDGPLLGACLLACKSQLNIPIIPNNLQVLDASRSHLVLESATGQVWRKHFRNHVFRPEIVFRFPLSVPPEGTVVVLEEEFTPEAEPTRIGQYQVMARRENNSNCDVVLDCAVDEDGVLTLGVDYRQAVLEGYLVRSDQLFVSASDHRNPISGFGKLAAHYQKTKSSLV